MRRAVRLLSLAWALVSSASCDGCGTKGHELQMAREPTRRWPVPPEVARMISRVGPTEFNVDRQLLGLLARPQYDREHMNGQVVFEYFGQTLKLSPEKSGETWGGPQLYLDLEARIERRAQAARAILNALGVKEDDFPGETPWDRAMAALDKANESIDAAMARHQIDPEVARYRAALPLVIAEMQQLKDWTPSITGSLPALLGFADLDRIEQVNGTPVRSYGAAYDVLAKVAAAERIEIDVNRGGAPIHLTYHIVSTDVAAH